MNKILQILEVSVIVVIIYVVSFASGIQSQPVKVTDEMVTIDYLELIQLNPPDDYIYRLEPIISENYDPYLRERAIFSLTDIAIRKNQSDEIVGFLKDIAITEKNESIRNAAYANIDLIRTIYQRENIDSMNLAVIGKIQKGENISIIAKISSTIPVTSAIIGINRLHKGIEILSNPIVRLNISENESHLVNQSVEFKLRLKDPGRYKIPISLLMSLDRVDYDLIYKYIYLNVSSTNSTSYDALHIEGQDSKQIRER